VGAAYLLCGDRHAAEDLVQTALAKLHVAWPRVRRSGAEDAYVRRILVNASIDAHRRPWRREQTAAELPEVPAPSAFDTGERDELVQALATLGPRQRRILVLRYWLGLTIDEVAADLQVTSGTVKTPDGGEHGLDRSVVDRPRAGYHPGPAPAAAPTGRDRHCDHVSRDGRGSRRERTGGPDRWYGRRRPGGVRRDTEHRGPRRYQPGGRAAVDKSSRRCDRAARSTT